MNIYYLISLGILGTGLVICLAFILLGKRNSKKGIDRYENIRDELTLRKEKKEVFTDYSGGIGLGNIIGGIIVILVGFSLLPIVAEEVGIAQADSNVTGAADTLLGLTTIFFALAIMITSIALATSGLRNAGMV